MTLFPYTTLFRSDLSPNVKFDTMKEPQVKFIVPEKLTREDKNSFESPSACASGTVVVLSHLPLAFLNDLTITVANFVLHILV